MQLILYSNTCYLKEYEVCDKFLFVAYFHLFFKKMFPYFFLSICNGFLKNEVKFFFKVTLLWFFAWMYADYAGNLSISLPAGIENNSDCVSNGEWTRKRATLKLCKKLCGVWNLWGQFIWKKYSLVNDAVEGESPVILYGWFQLGLISWVHQFGNADGIGRWCTPNPKYSSESDSEQVAWAKPEKHFGKRVQSTWNG